MPKVSVGPTPAGYGCVGSGDTRPNHTSPLCTSNPAGISHPCSNTHICMVHNPINLLQVMSPPLFSERQFSLFLTFCHLFYQSEHLDAHL